MDWARVWDTCSTRRYSMRHPRALVSGLSRSRFRRVRASWRRRSPVGPMLSLLARQRAAAFCGERVAASPMLGRSSAFTIVDETRVFGIDELRRMAQLMTQRP